MSYFQRISVLGLSATKALGVEPPPGVTSDGAWHWRERMEASQCHSIATQPIYKIVMDQARWGATSQMANGCAAHASR